MTASNANDNLIAEAQAALDGPETEASWDLIERLAAALESAPVSSGRLVAENREAFIEASWRWMSEGFRADQKRTHAGALFDALLASGVVSLQSDGVPQTQPDREAVVTVMVDRYAEVSRTIPEQFMRSRMLNVLNALLPLLGQPRTDAPTPAEVIDWIEQAAAPIHESKLHPGTFAVVVIKKAREHFLTDAPLDPEPWVFTGTTTRTAFPRMYGLMTHWEPQEGFEQDQARYPRTDTTEPGDKP